MRAIPPSDCPGLALPLLAVPSTLVACAIHMSYIRFAMREQDPISFPLCLSHHLNHLHIPQSHVHGSLCALFPHN
jgi:hypothetical protein